MASLTFSDTIHYYSQGEHLINRSSPYSQLLIIQFINKPRNLLLSDILFFLNNNFSNETR